MKFDEKCNIQLKSKQMRFMRWREYQDAEREKEKPSHSSIRRKEVFLWYGNEILSQNGNGWVICDKKSKEPQCIGIVTSTSTSTSTMPYDRTHTQHTRWSIIFVHVAIFILSPFYHVSRLERNSQQVLCIGDPSRYMEQSHSVSFGCAKRIVHS